MRIERTGTAAVWSQSYCDVRSCAGATRSTGHCETVACQVLHRETRLAAEHTSTVLRTLPLAVMEQIIMATVANAISWAAQLCEAMLPTSDHPFADGHAREASMEEDNFSKIA